VTSANVGVNTTSYCRPSLAVPRRQVIFIQFHQHLTFIDQIAGFN